jgi:hypothetical protein
MSIKRENNAIRQLLKLLRSRFKQDKQRIFIDGRYNEINLELLSIALTKFCMERDVEVDFIKMDIEGAETEALLGAANILRTVRPSLAIAAYHFAPDLWQLADIVRGMNPTYRFYLRHYSESGLESVIYAL